MEPPDNAEALEFINCCMMKDEIHSRIMNDFLKSDTLVLQAPSRMRRSKPVMALLKVGI